ncbi:type II secretion system protein [Candidatus Saccharibacteria bacterium]|nr:type II secretion system protein [Candidatus Saccharibacteria bacterium]
MNQRGFTIIELLALIVLLITVGAVFWTQKDSLETAAKDDSRKTSINAMYYSLEEVYYPTNKYYPKTLSASILLSVDSSLFKDPQGLEIGKAESDLSYQGKDCTDEACKSYTLRAKLKNEADYIKESRKN